MGAGSNLMNKTVAAVVALIFLAIRRRKSRVAPVA